MRSHKTFDRDMFMSQSARKSAQNTLGVINAVQDMKPHEQVAAIAAAFVLLTEHYDQNPADMLTSSRRMIYHNPDNQYPEFAGVRDYMENEW